MNARAYYNEIDPYAAQWLRNLIDAGLIQAGDVDERSIVDVAADDLAGYRQCHFFAGIGGWAVAARLAGWPDDRELWTGSPPCQPFSVAGRQRGQDDERHLWPHYFRLIRARRPVVCMGEQVAAAVGKDWLDGVLSDLESIGYAGRAAVVPACAINAPHRRDRLWFVAARDGAVGDSEREGLEGFAGHGDGSSGWSRADRPVTKAGVRSDLADANSIVGQVGTHTGRSEEGSRAREVTGFVRADIGALADADQLGASEERQQRGWQLGGVGSDPWARHGWIIGHDGKARRVEPSIRLLAHGVPARVGRLRAYGNAIVPQVAAEVIRAYEEARGLMLIGVQEAA